MKGHNYLEGEAMGTDYVGVDQDGHFHISIAPGRPHWYARIVCDSLYDALADQENASS